MKNCSNCLKKDVCNHCNNIMNNFYKIIRTQFGGSQERQEYIDMKNLIGESCQFYLEKGEK